VYLTSCWRIYGVGVSPSIVAGLLPFLQGEFTWHPTRQRGEQYASWSLYFVLSQSMDNDFAYCMLRLSLLQGICSMTVGDGNHIDQFFHDWWRWISTVEMLSSDKLLKKWSCRRDWFNSEVLFLHGCSEAWMWTWKKQQEYYQMRYTALHKLQK
jgi:hypothetical protein